MSQPLRLTPDLNTRQDGVNAFLAALHHAFGSQAGQQGGTAPTIRASAGPRVFQREISSHDPSHRRGTFHSYRGPNQPNRDMAGTLPLPAGFAPMALADYSATIRDAIPQASLHGGTLYLCASREAPHQLRQFTAWRRYVVALPPGAQPPPGTAPNMNPAAAVNPATSDLWHNVAVFVQSRPDYPQRRANYGDGSAPTHQQWTFDGTYRRCFVYDPSFAHELGGPGQPGPATQHMNTHGYYRLSNFVFLRTTTGLVWSSTRGFASRASWIRWPLPGPNQGPVQPHHATVFIGGGGNSVGLDECRRMACVWMQQVAWLS